MKSTIQCVVVCLLSFFVGCSEADNQKADAQNWSILIPSASQESSWRLEASAVPAILNGAKAHLEQELAKTTDDLGRSNITAILSRWDGYSCQLFPVIDRRDGRRVAALHFFPTRERASAFKDWRSVAVIVKGGGYDFWTVSYDPERREYSSFRVNAIQ